jgi:hypothetical protein
LQQLLNLFLLLVSTSFVPPEILSCKDNNFLLPSQ